jgi:anti-sigma regulatory factor (Ser/Thr protein kinase)
LELQTDWKDTEGEYERMRRERIAVEPYAHRKVTITQRVTPQRATFVVKDDGPGFNPSELPDPTDPENLLKTGGRGILLMRTFMDHVSFSDKGNELTMIKERSKKSDAVAK